MTYIIRYTKDGETIAVEEVFGHPSEDHLREQTELLGADFFPHLGETRKDFGAIPLGDDPLGGEHGRMRFRALDVLKGHALVKINGCVDLFHDLRCGHLEPATPHRIGSRLAHLGDRPF